MISLKVKKRLNRIIAGIVSAAMTLTMVPDVWLPVHAEIVRDEILNSDVVCLSSDSETADAVNAYHTAFFNGHKYQFIDKNMSWTKAKTYCEEIGGHLATITDESEQEFINSQMLKFNTQNRLYWLGGFLNNSKWTWVTGEKFSYTNWGAGEPTLHVYQPCLQIYSPVAKYEMGTWNNHDDCDRTTYFDIIDIPNKSCQNKKDVI